MNKKRDLQKEYKEYHGKPEQIARRSSRNKARRKMIKKVGKKAMQGKHVDHSNMNPLDNSSKNLRVVDAKTNLKKQPKRK